ncbi:hypothetical protein ACOMCU_05325 [Lysinibacillus sp. UGB7]|uniref:hypothetical protein n=1 Tax=Lysinibacillus sp. UGB7 TaxID=3411039 RepID=UPI003B7E8B25
MFEIASHLSKQGNTAIRLSYRRCLNDYMRYLITGLLYTPPKSIIVIAFIMTGVLMAILTFASVPITKVHIRRY